MKRKDLQQVDQLLTKKPREKEIKKIEIKFGSSQESDNLGVVDSTFSNLFSVFLVINQRVIVPETPKPTMAARNSDPTPTWISCNHCRQRFVSSQNVRGVVVEDRDPNARYYVADNIPAMFLVRPKKGQITYRGIRGVNEVTNLSLTPVFCLICKEPAGWRVLTRSQSHPTVNVGKFLLPVPPPQP